MLDSGEELSAAKLRPKKEALNPLGAKIIDANYTHSAKLN